MAWCLSAPSHYLNQFWLIINEAVWDLAKSNSTETVLDITHNEVFENYKFENVLHPPGANELITQ